MNWSDIPRDPTPRMLRQFGGLTAAACVVVAFTGAGTHHRWLWLTAGTVIALVAAVRPRTLRPIFVGWMVAAFPIGWAVGKLALVVMFFGLFTLTGLLFRIMGRDPMGRRRRSGSYWTPRDQSTTPSDYLRQY